MPAIRVNWPVLIGVVAILAAAAPVAAGPEHGRGNIVSVDWGSMQIVIKDPQGGTETWKIDPDSRVKFSDAPEFFPRPTVRDLAPRMYVYFIFEGMTRVIYDVDVKEVPPDLRKPRAEAKPATPAPAPPAAASEELKVRIDGIDRKQGRFRAVVGKRTETFRVQNPRALDRFDPGDTAIVTVETVRGERLVTAIRLVAGGK
jgi:hypothetical protein